MRVRRTHPSTPLHSDEIHGSLSRPFLMFEGVAEEASNFYVSLFSNSEIRTILHYGPEEAGAEGSVVRAELVIAGQEVMCIDSPAKHDFGFTPAVSLFVECETEVEQSRPTRGSRMAAPF